MKCGWAATSTNRLVAAKQTNRILYLVCSLGLIFTATITITFRTIINGQLMAFRIMDIIADTLLYVVFPNPFVHGTALDHNSIIAVHNGVTEDRPLGYRANFNREMK